MSGDAETGVCIMQMEAGLDTGPVLARQSTPIGAAETTGGLHDRLSALGAALIVQVLPQLPGLAAVTQSDDGVLYAAKIEKSEAVIDWVQPASKIDHQIRALAPFPGAWTLINGERVKLLGSECGAGSAAPGTVLDASLTIACGTGALCVTRAQRAGKAAQDVGEFLRGWPVPVGLKLGF
jgi:methionyl-tRNA formyltransferase